MEKNLASEELSEKDKKHKEDAEKGSSDAEEPEHGQKDSEDTESDNLGSSPHVAHGSDSEAVLDNEEDNIEEE